MGDAFSLNRSVLDQEQCVNKNWKEGWMDGWLPPNSGTKHCVAGQGKNGDVP